MFVFKIKNLQFLPKERRNELRTKNTERAEDSFGWTIFRRGGGNDGINSSLPKEPRNYRMKKYRMIEAMMCMNNLPNEGREWIVQEIHQVRGRIII